MTDENIDVLGIGFGPSNLALAIALEERGIPAVFLERQERFGWHRGMLISGATMQVSFLKDLVTMRDPTSGFSFISYLHERGRLAAFINGKEIYPTRLEFHDYLSWAAARLEHRVRYGVEAVDAIPVVTGGEVRHIEVLARRAGGGRPQRYRARNLVVATGLAPYVPPEAPASPAACHSEYLLQRLGDVPLDADLTFVVVGAGQSAAEVVEYLHRTYPRARVHSVFARYGYSPADDSSFVNGIFDPQTVDLFFQAPGEVKDLLFGYHANTNYSVVDGDLIAGLYRSAYAELVAGERRLIMRNLSRVTAARPAGTGLDVDIAYLPDGSVASVHADWLIYATGYRPRSPLTVLGQLSSYCKAEPDQPLPLDRDHRIVTSEPMRCGIYVQGAAEATHGISATLLSTTAIRAGEIADAIATDLDSTGLDSTGLRDTGLHSAGLHDTGLHDTELHDEEHNGRRPGHRDRDRADA
jgi:L-ornithine N5-monooxygenase